ncbi:MTH1187 family thiamine-binding protein [Priestia filamentosa]|nr:MTH1187 family thiamine-binding protein [Priestia filamentosa]MDT3765470.1 MTH1187 family thiamine-binding protein [Priestia filamentosa]WRU95949.1 MTH1187 family thiamine-binding protein [Priestia filamentosa]
MNNRRKEKEEQEMTTLLEISVTPVGTESTSYKEYVTDAIKLIKDKGLNYHIGPSSTVIEGEIDQVMEVAKAIHKHSLKRNANRVVTNLRIEERSDKDMSISHQMRAVKEASQ